MNEWVQPNQPDEKQSLEAELSELLRSQKPEDLEQLLKLAGVQEQKQFVSLLTEAAGKEELTAKLSDKAKDILKKAMANVESRLTFANRKAAGVRDRLREQYEAVPLPSKEACLAWPLTGFLLRSAVVEGWRGLEVMAYRNLDEAEKESLKRTLKAEATAILNRVLGNEKQKSDQKKYEEERDRLRAELRELLRGQTSEQRKQLFESAGAQTQEEFLKVLLELVRPLKPLRIEQLSKDVMFGLFNGIFHQLVIRQPQEGLHFGLTADKQSYTKTLRELGYSNPARAGEIIPNARIDLSSAGMMRDSSTGVVNIKQLGERMSKDLEGLKQLKPDSPKFTSAEFAVELVEAAGEFTYFPKITTVP
jgi:hypothetical protein